jgi:transposase
MTKTKTEKPLRFYEAFPTEASALKFLMEMRYGHLKHCPNPKCKRPFTYNATRGKKCWNCRYCYHKLYPASGTIIENSPLSVQTWFDAIYQIACSRSGVRSLQLARSLKVHHTTADRMITKILTNLDYNLPNKLSGKVELDESYWGKSRFKRGRNNAKHIIFCMIERHGDVIACEVPDTKAATLLPIVAENVHKSSQIYTDEYRVYCGLKKHGFDKHTRIRHKSKKYIDEKRAAGTNCAENFFSRLKSILKHHRKATDIRKYINLAQFQHRNQHVEDQFPVMLAHFFKPTIQE